MEDDPDMFWHTRGGQAVIPRTTHADITRCSECVLDWNLAKTDVERVDMFLENKPTGVGMLIEIATNCRKLEKLRVALAEPTVLAGGDEIVQMLKKEIQVRRCPLQDDKRPPIFLEVFWREEVLEGSYVEEVRSVRDAICDFLRCFGIACFGF